MKDSIDESLFAEPIRYLTHEEYEELTTSIRAVRAARQAQEKASASAPPKNKQASSSSSDSPALQSTEPAKSLCQPNASRTKEVLQSRETALEEFEKLNTLFDGPVFMPVPADKKHPILPGWENISPEQARSDTHRELVLVAFEQGKVGIMLGVPYGRLLTANIHDTAAIEELTRRCTWLLDTTRSWAARGCQFWMRLDKSCDYPQTLTAPLKNNGRVVGELRFNGQSIIHCGHHAGVAYQHNGKAPLEVDLSDLYDLGGWGSAQYEVLFPLIYKELNIKDLLLCLDDEEPLPPFPLDTLPKTLRFPVEEVMRHYRVPALIPATCALVMQSAALGRGIVTKSPVRRTYANLYAIMGALSGTGKTVVFDEFMAPLEALQSEMLQAFATENKPRNEAELKLVQAEVQSLLKCKRNQRGRDLSEEARRERLGELLQRQAELEDRLEAATRLWCVDFTSEALGVLLANNNEQMAVLSDEGGLALYNILGRYTKGLVTDDILLCKAKSVNGTTVDRLGREPIILRQPCVSLLLLVQPDLLRTAFSNERLLIGGLLARCLTADSRMKVQYEDESTLPEPDPVIMEAWNQHIRVLVNNFRFSEEPYWINVEEGVRGLSRKFHNEIVDQIRGSLWDVVPFALRWVERAWEIALNLHVGSHGIECYRHVLSKETFANAVLISNYFANRQLEVLNAMRAKAINDNRERLQEILERNEKKTITLRDLNRRHGLDRQEVLNTVKNHSTVFGIAEVRRQSGGTPSIVAFLKSNPPPKMQAEPD